MKVKRAMQMVVTTALILIGALAMAHISPPRVLISDQDAARALLPAASVIAARDIRLSPAQRQLIKKQWGWQPDEKTYRAYVGKDAEGRSAGVVVFVGEVTIHGLVRSAVGMGSDGKIHGAMVVAVSDESYTWIKPLIDQNFAGAYIGLDSRASFPPVEPARKRGESMSRFYARVLASLVQHGAVIYQASTLSD